MPPTLKVFDKQSFSLKSPQANMSVLMQPINKNYKIETSPQKPYYTKKNNYSGTVSLVPNYEI